MTFKSSYSIDEVIGCGVCKSDEEGSLFIGQEARACQVRGLKQCPCCQVPLNAGDVIAVGFDTRTSDILEISDAA